MIWGYHYFWKHPYFSIALARMIAGYRKIKSFVKEHHLEIQILAQKPILLSGCVTGFHSPYIEDTRIKKRWISSIAQLKTPFTPGFLYNIKLTPTNFPSSPWWSLSFSDEIWLWRLTRHILGPVLLMNNSRKALDKAKQVMKQRCCNGQFVRRHDGSSGGWQRSKGFFSWKSNIDLFEINIWLKDFPRKVH